MWAGLLSAAESRVENLSTGTVACVSSFAVPNSHMMGVSRPHPPRVANPRLRFFKAVDPVLRIRFSATAVNRAGPLGGVTTSFGLGTS